MLDISFEEILKYFVRLFWDFAIFAVVNIVLLNVIFGIIIDNFAGKKKLKTN